MHGAAKVMTRGDTPGWPRFFAPPVPQGQRRMGNNHAWKPRAFFDSRFVKTEHRRAYRLAFILFWSILMYFLVQRYVVSAGVVTDISMQPSLPEGSYYLLNKYLYVFGLPERGHLPRSRAADALAEDLLRHGGQPARERGQPPLRARPLQPYSGKNRTGPVVPLPVADPSTPFPRIQTRCPNFLRKG